MNIRSKIIFDEEHANGWLPWGALAPFLALVMVLVALITTGTFILEPLGYVDSELNHIGPIGLFAMLMVSFGAAGLLTLLWVKFIERRSFRSIGLLGMNGALTFGRGHLISIAMMTSIILIIWALGGYDVGAIAPALGDASSLLYVFLLLIGFAVQSSVEEIIFRGWLLSVLTRKFNLLAAVLISSALFTFMHFNPANPWHDNISTAAFALFACAWVIRTGNIWGIMGWHAGWNWFTAVGFEIPITGLETGTTALIAQLKPVGGHLLNGGTTGPEGSLACIVILLLGTLYLMRPKPKPATS